MASQTLYYGRLKESEVGGGHLVVQSGYVKFVKKAKTVSIVTDLNAVHSVKLKYRTGATAKSLSCVLSCSGTVTGKRLIISRTTLGGTMSGAYVWYEAIGQ